jgi:cell division protein FtsB
MLDEVTSGLRGPMRSRPTAKATVAIRGIRDQIAMQNRIFAMCVVIAIGCFGYLFTTTTQTVTTVARMEERLDAMDKRLDGIDTRLDALTAAIERLLASQKQGAFQ